MLAIKTGDRTTFFQQDEQATYLFESAQIVLGTVKSVGAPVCGRTRCQWSPEQWEPGTISTPALATVDRVLRGGLVAGPEGVEVRQMGVPGGPVSLGQAVPLKKGDAALLFLQPGQVEAIGDFMPGDYYWVGPAFAYGVENGRVAPLPGARDLGDPPLTVEQVAAGIAELFQGVRPCDPREPRPAASPVPTGSPVSTAPTESAPTR